MKDMVTCLHIWKRDLIEPMGVALTKEIIQTHLCITAD